MNIGDKVIVLKKSLFKKNRRSYDGIIQDITTHEDEDAIGSFTYTIARVCLETGEIIEIETESTAIKSYSKYKIRY